MNRLPILLIAALGSASVIADSSTLDAAVGGGIGGAAGAAIGNEVGGRDGAIIGGAVGGAVGAAVATDDAPHHDSKSRQTRYEGEPAGGHPGYKFCPPGQAKKGRC